MEQVSHPLLPELLTCLQSPKATVRYGSSKTLIILSHQDPTLLYPHFQDFIELLDSPHRILTWNALTIIANLTTIDTNHYFEHIFNHYYSFLKSGYLITAATVIENSPTIATNKPLLADTIATRLLTIDTLHTSPHLTQECKHILAQKTLTALDQFYDLLTNHEPILKFATKHTTSTRTTTKKTAQAFLNKHRGNP